VPVDEVIAGGLTGVHWSVLGDSTVHTGVLPTAVDIPSGGITYLVTGTVASNATGVITNTVNVTVGPDVGIGPEIVDGITPPVTPTVTVSGASTTILKAGQTDLITFTFNEPPVGFNPSDVSVTNGTLGNTLTVSPTDPTVYTATFTPATGVN
jgi:hypothetical protein